MEDVVVSCNYKATATCVGVPGEARGQADISARISEQVYLSAQSATSSITDQIEHLISATDEFSVAARAKVGTIYREINMALYDAIGAAQSPCGSAAAVDSGTLTNATGASIMSDFSKPLCEFTGSARACQYEGAAQGDVVVTAIFTAGARALIGSGRTGIDSVLRAAVGAEQSSCISAAAQHTRHVPAVHAAGSRQLNGDADQNTEVHCDISFAQSGHGSAGLCQYLVVPGGGTAGARVTSGSDDREISALLREAMDTLQASTTSAYLLLKHSLLFP